MFKIIYHNFFDYPDNAEYEPTLYNAINRVRDIHCIDRNEVSEAIERSGKFQTYLVTIEKLQGNQPSINNS